MTDIVVGFIEQLRKVWPDIPVIASQHVEGRASVIGVSIQRWIQRPEGCEVTLNVSYYPEEVRPMKHMLKWLEGFYGLLQSHEPDDLFTQWWGNSAQFLTDPYRINCEVILRHSKEVA